MTWRHFTWVLTQPIEPAGAKHIATLLAWRATDGDNHSFPTQERLAKESGQGLRTVRRHLGMLERDGWISRTRRRAKDGRYVVDGYLLNVDDNDIEAAVAAVKRKPPANLAGGPAANMAGGPAAKNGQASGQIGRASGQIGQHIEMKDTLRNNTMNLEPGTVERWQEACDAFRHRYGAATYASWVKPLALHASNALRITLSAPSTFIRDYCRQHYEPFLRERLGVTIEWIVVRPAAN